MFETQHWSVDSTRKRAREEEEEEEAAAMHASGITGFTEHRNKRLHSLPVRTSPNHKRSFPISHLPPSTVTPADSDSEDLHQPPSHFSPWSDSSPALSHQQHDSPNLPMDMDRDTDMMAGEGDGHHLQPGPAQPDHHPVAPSINGRIPTPIHATFAAQVRGSSWGTTNHQGPHPTPNAGLPYPQAFPPPPESSVPRSLDGGVEWSMVQNRRLPSPISESGGEEAPASPGMILDSSSQAVLQRPYLPHLPHSTNPGTAIHPNVEIITRNSGDADVGMMDTDPAVQQQQQQQDPQSPTSAPATPSPRGKFGHSRSKHTLNSWTLQPGMKKSFSIGYRADCEKCRMKIPGHFNHIIVS
ncbi:uncharacterized protein JN550_008900 [Neoarthrinium moseri]|uniref:uncharacterized protein n=1 Tax=Neoarthrinium moseri TaxID=1658444 RepID=UPI001FDD3071|nr:uncharacterized protein JN550_008900 [Neoarthrinium moseri]KAI1864343.1 hypothetical protein JN550_008900 [Neoarthrinium moseri]